MKIRIRGRHLAGAALTLTLVAAAGFVYADVTGTFKAAWNCAKGTLAASGGEASDIYKKGEVLASLEVTGGKCAAEASVDETGFAAVSGSIVAIKIASPGSLPNGQCLSTLKKSLAKPFAGALASLVPIASAKQKLISMAQSDAGSDAVWSQLQIAPPPLSPLVGHADCACTLIDNGVTLTDMSVVAKTIRATSQSCSAMLDQSGLGFVNKWGTAAIGWAKGALATASKAWQSAQGKTPPGPDEAVFYGFYGIFWRKISPTRS